MALPRPVRRGPRAFALVRYSVPILESLAAVAADRGDHLRAAGLAGAADGLLEGMGARPPRTAPMRSIVVGPWERGLTVEGADRAYVEGRRMDLRAAIAFALGEAAPLTLQARPQPGPGREVLTSRQLVVARLVAATTLDWLRGQRHRKGVTRLAHRHPLAAWPSSPLTG